MTSHPSKLPAASVPRWASAEAVRVRQEPLPVATAPHIPGRYLEALEAQVTLARYYDKGGKGVLTGAVADLASSVCKLANPIYIAPEVADALDDAMGTVDLQMALYRQDAPCEYGFAYIGGEEWPYADLATGFTATCRAIAWAVNDEEADFILFGRSFQPAYPTSADNSLQINGILQYRWGVPLIQAADAIADLLMAEGRNIRGALSLTGKLYTAEETREALFEHQIAHLRYCAAVWTFMKQRIAARSHGNVDRAARRRLPDSYKGSDFVSIVHLRAIAHPKRETPNGEPGGKWTVRSIRRAHWANRWCEGKSKQCDYGGQHSEPRLEPRFIQATVCGPEGAPLKGGTKLFAVVR